jgi:hypothetical protein
VAAFLEFDCLTGFSIDSGISSCCWLEIANIDTGLDLSGRLVDHGIQTCTRYFCRNLQD